MEEIKHSSESSGMIPGGNASAGSISIISTPIGNMKDITMRAVEALSSADIVAAEDTRRTNNLLSAHNLHKKLVSCHIYNEHKTVSYLVESALSGKKIAYVSDAGTPCISDPGYLIIREALAKGIEPQIIRRRTCAENSRPQLERGMRRGNISLCKRGNHRGH
ncbi:MAG: SAM-dependent methyltransferase [Lentisphaerae bacterium]|nr:SAM-dependent methyltransferase [Lentisphaerota bacterium]